MNGVLNLLDAHQCGRRRLSKREKDGQAPQGAIGHVPNVETDLGGLSALLKELDEPAPGCGARLDFADAGSNGGQVFGDPGDVSPVLLDVVEDVPGVVTIAAENARTADGRLLPDRLWREPIRARACFQSLEEGMKERMARAKDGQIESRFVEELEPHC
jgi:hypothetical protein